MTNHVKAVLIVVGVWATIVGTVALIFNAPAIFMGLVVVAVFGMFSVMFYAMARTFFEDDDFPY